MTDRPKQFLPGVYGASVPTVSATPKNATAGNGPIAGYTTYFDLNLVNFDWVTWHNYEWQNWVNIDALLNAAIGFLNLKGIWQPNTAYVAGETVFDPNDTTLLYICLTDNTSGTDFQTDIPLYWKQKDSASPPVETVFGRVGAIVGLETDYDTFFYTKAEIDAAQGTQDSAINANAADIVVNAGNIASLSTGLGSLSGDVQTNTINIGTNASDINAVEAAIAALGSMSVIDDAPSDGKPYARLNAAWSEVTDGDFLPLTGGTLTGDLRINSPSADLLLNGSSASSPTTIQFLRNSVGQASISRNQPNGFLSLFNYNTSGSFGREYRFRAQDQALDDETVLRKVDADGLYAQTVNLGTMAGIDDAPSDGKQYARKDAAWAEVVSAGGDFVSKTDTSLQTIKSDLTIENNLRLNSTPANGLNGMRLYQDSSNAAIDRDAPGSLLIRQSGVTQFRMYSSGIAEVYDELRLNAASNPSGGRSAVFDQRAVAGTDVVQRFRQDSLQVAEIRYDASANNMRIQVEDSAGNNSLDYYLRNSSQAVSDETILRKIDADALYGGGGGGGLPTTGGTMTGDITMSGDTETIYRRNGDDTDIVRVGYGDTFQYSITMNDPVWGVTSTFLFDAKADRFGYIVPDHGVLRKKDADTLYAAIGSGGGSGLPTTGGTMTGDIVMDDGVAVGFNSGGAVKASLSYATYQAVLNINDDFGAADFKFPSRFGSTDPDDVLRRKDGDARYEPIGGGSGGNFLPLTGGTLTGGLTIAQGSGSFPFSLRADGSRSNTYFSASTGQFAADNMAITSDIQPRLALTKTGGPGSPTIQMYDQNNALFMISGDYNNNILIINTPGGVAAHIEEAGTATSSDLSVITREKGDARYAPIGGLLSVGAQEFHDPTGVASWRIVGNTLECWGSAVTDSTGFAPVTFPKTFNAAPVVTNTVNTDQNINAIARMITATGCVLGTFGVNNATVMWRTIGEWDGVS